MLLFVFEAVYRHVGGGYENSFMDGFGFVV
jgi:hypothetical protein